MFITKLLEFFRLYNYFSFRNFFISFENLAYNYFSFRNFFISFENLATLLRVRDHHQFETAKFAPGSSKFFTAIRGFVNPIQSLDVVWVTTSERDSSSWGSMRQQWELHVILRIYFQVSPMNWLSIFGYPHHLRPVLAMIA